MSAGVGIRYPEWDHRTSGYRPAHCAASRARRPKRRSRLERTHTRRASRARQRSASTVRATTPAPRASPARAPRRRSRRRRGRRGLRGSAGGTDAERAALPRRAAASARRGGGPPDRRQRLDRRLGGRRPHRTRGRKAGDPGPLRGAAVARRPARGLRVLRARRAERARGARKELRGAHRRRRARAHRGARERRLHAARCAHPTRDGSARPRAEPCSPSVPALRRQAQRRGRVRGTLRHRGYPPGGRRGAPARPRRLLPDDRP